MGLLYRKPSAGGGGDTALVVSSPQTLAGNGVTVTPSASANTKGNYATLIASTSAATKLLGISIWVNAGGTTTNSWLVDIAIGAAAAETVVVANLGASVCQQFGQEMIEFLFPLDIPAGTRISARCQSNTATSPETVSVKATVFNGAGWVGGTGIDTIGASTATSRGTAVTTGINSNKGSYAQITASTSRAYTGIFGVLSAQGVAGAYGILLTDIATGAAASETVIIPEVRTVNHALQLTSPTIPFLPISIPSGTRLSARIANSEPGALARGVILYGVY